MTTLGSWLKSQGFTVDDNNVPYGRDTSWQGVSFLMVHHTVSPCQGSEQKIATYCRQGGPGTFPPLCQIMLGNSGKLWMTCKEHSNQKDPGRASHAGRGSGYGVAKDSMNAHALGIECQCDGTHKLATHQKQYETLIKLLAALSKKYGVPIKNIIGHKEWSSTGKVDPKDNMDTIRADVARELAGTTTSGEPYHTKDVYRSKCGFGEPTNGDKDSDTVKELQELLKRAKLTGAVTLTVDGKYGVSTDTMVRLWQEQKCGDTPDPARRSYLGPKQFAFMFPDSVYTLHDDGNPAIASAPPPEIPPVKPPEVPTVADNVLIWHDYTEKPLTKQIFAPGGWVGVDTPPLKKVPASGHEDHMVYCRLNFTWKPLPKVSSFEEAMRTIADYAAKIEIQFVRGDGDATAYDERHFSYGTKSVPFQQVHWELGEKGLAGKWLIKAHGGLLSVEIDTRYAKTAVIAKVK